MLGGIAGVAASRPSRMNRQLMLMQVYFPARAVGM